MFKTSRLRFLVAAVVAIAFVAIPIAVLANHSWGSYHWARTDNNLFTLKLGDNVSSTWDSYLATASSDWSQSTVLNTTVVAGSANPKNCRPPNGRVEVCNSSYGNNGWLGLAQIWVSGEHIVRGAVKVNDYYFNQPQYNSAAWRHLVMCQEIGHTFGLDHQDTNFDNPNLGTCMDYTSDPAGPPSNEHPNQGDYDQLRCIYDPAANGDTLTTTTHSCTGTGHLDSTTTVGQSVTNHMPPAFNDLDLEGPGQWGRVIRGSRAAGYTVHELDFGGGYKIITFVTWARAGQN